MLARRLFILALSAALPWPTAFGWGPEGHRIVAAIATQRLTPKAQAAVAAILPAGQTLESIASWADEVRRDRRETGPWHSIDIRDSKIDLARECPSRLMKNVLAASDQVDDALQR